LVVLDLVLKHAAWTHSCLLDMRARRGFVQVVTSPFRYYETERKVEVQDWRLSFLHIVCVLGALAFVVIQILLLHQYAEFEPAVSQVNLWSDTIVPELPNLPDFFCLNQSYDFVPEQLAMSGYFFTENITCRHLNIGDSLRIGNDQVDFTLLRLIVDDANGLNSTRESYFAQNSEYIPTHFQHTVTTSWGAWARVPTTIQRSDGTVFREYADQDIQFQITVRDWLEIANLNLEDINFLGVLGKNQPRFRLTGAVLVVRLDFSNLRPWNFF